MQGSPNEGIGVYREALNLLHPTCWWSRVGRFQRRIRATGRIPGQRADRNTLIVDHSVLTTARRHYLGTAVSAATARRWYPSGPPQRLRAASTPWFVD